MELCSAGIADGHRTVEPLHSLTDQGQANAPTVGTLRVSFRRLGAEAVLQDVIDGMDEIAATAKLVVVMPSPKLYDLNPLSAYKKSLMFGQPFSMATIGIERDDNARKANEAMRNAAAKRDNIVYIERSDLFTSGGRMSDLDSRGIPFSLDGGHISIYGAKASADAFLRTAKYRDITRRAVAGRASGR